MRQKHRRLVELGCRTSKGLAIASALFCLFVCVLVISNYLRFRSAAPPVEGTLARISERLTQAPEDEKVSEQIEALELQIKNVYTSDISLIRIGTFLLVGGATVLLISSTLMFRLRGGKPERTNTDTGKMPAIPAGLPGELSRITGRQRRQLHR